MSQVPIPASPVSGRSSPSTSCRGDDLMHRSRVMAEVADGVRCGVREGPIEPGDRGAPIGKHGDEAHMPLQ
ncbi:MAG TPA: hypothetical protein VJ870_11425 [Amycolatopsis sp.]|nr:hypothetical protein [Amycolatopsis sp.]